MHGGEGEVRFACRPMSMDLLVAASRFVDSAASGP
jgi:hypothetical protein